ncbi:hypothetical protein C8R43DRAFT_189765 [Mycena crocata]|nr:hypothetical protein C8R43DRAFT_189765 [Mycena crocata]
MQYDAFAAGGERPAGVAIPRIPSSPVLAVSRTAGAAATAIPQCIAVPRAGSNFRIFAAGGQRPAAPAMHRVSCPVSRPPQPPRRGGDINSYMYRRPASGVKIQRKAAGGQHSQFAGFPPRAHFHVLLPWEPPRSGGHVDYYMYRRPANEVVFPKFCRRRPTSPWTRNSPEAPLARFCVLALQEPPRSGGDVNYYMYRRPASGGKNSDILPPEANVFLTPQFSELPLLLPRSPTVGAAAAMQQPHQLLYIHVPRGGQISTFCRRRPTSHPTCNKMSRMN